MSLDIAKIRREDMRWQILLTLSNGAPYYVAERIMLLVCQAIYPDTTDVEVRKQLDYLTERDLVEIEKSPSGPWSAKLTRYGTDIVEYTIDCEPGIARPIKYG